MGWDPRKHLTGAALRVAFGVNQGAFTDDAVILSAPGSREACQRPAADEVLHFRTQSYKSVTFGWVSL